MSGLDHVPDVRDGLTLAERAVLRAAPPAEALMPKSAAVVGRAITLTGLAGAELYDVLVRLAQDWWMRWPLIDGVGNFGSVDDDPAADAKYTEARRTAIGQALFAADDPGAADEADVGAGDAAAPLRGGFPQLLANGSWEGIANIPPHHLGELAEAIALRIDDPSCSLDDVLAVMPGPDYPTGGVIVDPTEVRDAYATGRGAIRVRATVEVTVADGTRDTAVERVAPEFGPDPSGAESAAEWSYTEPQRGDQIVVSELPFGVAKGGEHGVIRNITDVVRDASRAGNPSGVTDIQDFSDRRGMRLVLDVREGADPDRLREQLFQVTRLEAAVPVLLVALVEGEPQLCTLLELLDRTIAHQRDVRGGGPEVDHAIKRDLAALAAAHGGERRTKIAV